MPATILSWMAKCPLARCLVLTHGGAFTYTTPLTVQALRETHDEFLKQVIDVFKGVLLNSRVKWIEVDNRGNIGPGERKLCLTIFTGSGDRGESYSICGAVDRSYILFGKDFNSITALVLETTLSKSVDHFIRGELLFYILAYYVNYGLDTIGILVNPQYVYLVIPKRGVLGDFKKLFKKPDYEKAVERAEEKRSRRPWICNLCDLKHICPLGIETP